jgi:sugar lactone lactonase YvrE
MFDAATRTLIEGLGFPEGPRWRGEHLYFSDFHQRRVVQARLDGTMVTALRPDDIPSGLGFMPNGDLLVVSMLKRALLRQSAEGLEVVADLRKWTVAGANDMAVDGVGRAYVGNFGFDFRSGESPRTTVLLRVDPSGDVTVVADELLFPNGVAIDDDRGTLIVAETYAHRLTAFDLAADGSLSLRPVRGRGLSRRDLSGRRRPAMGGHRTVGAGASRTGGWADHREHTGVVGLELLRMHARRG